MAIKLRYPAVTAVMIIAVFILFAIYAAYRIYFHGRLSSRIKKDYFGYGAMWLTEGLPGYKRKRIIYRVLSVIGILALMTSMISACILMGRPSYKEKVTTGVQRRDIFLCLDVSYSLYALNYDFVNNLEKVVQGLDGDRIGISIYNTTTVLYMPMTDDKEFAVSKLEELKEHFRLQQEYMDKYQDLEDISTLTPEESKDFYDLVYKLDEFDAGLTVNSEKRGGSLVGEGLASCLYNFPSLNDSKRTRIILMVTDNEEIALKKPAVELDEAAALCLKNDVKVFGIFPPEKSFDEEYALNSYEELKDNMQAAVEGTGGAFYVADDDLDTKGIVAQIKTNKAMQVNEITMVKTTDAPQAALVICIAGLAVFAIIKAGGV